jgi:hypothetical protein
MIYVKSLLTGSVAAIVVGLACLAYWAFSAPQPDVGPLDFRAAADLPWVVAIIINFLEGYIRALLLVVLTFIGGFFWQYRRLSRSAAILR